MHKIYNKKQELFRLNPRLSYNVEALYYDPYNC